MNEVDSLPSLVERAIAGDERAWAAIVERFAPLVWSICRRFGLSHHDLDDVAQAVWLRLLDHLAAIRTPDALPGWLATTTRRECLRHLNVASGRQSREAGVPTEALAADDSMADDVEDLVVRAQQRDALRTAFRTLGERCRALLRLLLQDPPPAYARIATELAIPVGSIGPTRSRCLDTLRRAPEVAALLGAHLDAAEEVGHAT
jgi:RNA polymerase sigma factor (sigma-70 family)